MAKTTRSFPLRFDEQTEWIRERLKQVAEDNRVSQNEMIVRILADHLGPNPGTRDTVMGFVKLDFLGDINTDDECDWCGSPYTQGAFLCFRGDGKISAVVCISCAESVDGAAG